MCLKVSGPEEFYVEVKEALLLALGHRHAFPKLGKSCVALSVALSWTNLYAPGEASVYMAK